MPWEYIEHILCKHFHCTPAVLRTIDPDDMLITLTILDVESEVRRLQT